MTIPVIGIKGAGEMASGVAWRLFRCGFTKIFMMETPHPLAVRRQVSFCEAIHEKQITVEGIQAIKAVDAGGIRAAWQSGRIAVIADPDWQMIRQMTPQIVVDAILAKKNLGTRLSDAPLVIGLGPGFETGVDVHRVVETHRGHDLGRVLDNGCAQKNTGIPGAIGGYTHERVLRAPVAGLFEAVKEIADPVNSGDILGTIQPRTGESEPVKATISGVLRGLIRSSTTVDKGMKIGDIDPRGISSYCFSLSDKARAIAGGVLEAVMSHRS